MKMKFQDYKLLVEQISKFKRHDLMVKKKKNWAKIQSVHIRNSLLWSDKPRENSDKYPKVSVRRNETES